MLSTRLAVAGLSLALVATPAFAQVPGSFEIGGLGRYTKFDNSYQFDNGLGVGGRLGFYVSPLLEIVGEGSYLDIDRGGSELRIGGHQANYTPISLRGQIDWPMTASGAGLMFGAGVVRSSYRYTYNWGPTANLGFKIPILSNAAIRVDGVADYLPTPKTTNLGLRAGLSFFHHPAAQTIIERVAVATNDEELTRLRSDRARLDSIAAAYNRLRDSLATAPGCVCEQPAPAPMKVEKDNTPVSPAKPEPIKTRKDKP